MNAEFAQALVKAQAEMPAVAKKARAQYGAYMDLDHLLAGALPVLNRNGLMLAQFPTQNEQGFPTLTTVLIHESGEQLSFEMPLVMDTGAKMNATQAQGSAITYARRYAAAAALGISSEKDDDANYAPRNASAGGEATPISASKEPASSPPRPHEGPQAAPPPAEELTELTDEEKEARSIEWWDSRTLPQIDEAITATENVETLRAMLKVELGREARRKGKPRKTVIGPIQRKLGISDAEVEVAEGEGFAPVEQDTPEPAPGNGQVTAEKLKAALAFIQEQPSVVENAHAWTVPGVLLGLTQRGVTAGSLEEVPPDGLEMVWQAIPDGVRSSVDSLGPESLAKLAAQAT